MFPRCLLPWFLALAPTLAWCAEGEPLRPGRLPADLRQALAPGLHVQFTPREAEGAAPDHRVSRFAALAVPVNEPPTPFLPAGAFVAEFRGYLRTQLPGAVRFSLEGAGGAELWINGVKVLGGTGRLATFAAAEVELPRGYSEIRLRYESPTGADAAVQLHWQSDEFAREPLPAAQLLHDPRDPALRIALERRWGRELLAERNCFRCHRAPASANEPEAMPELTDRAPDLKQAGARLKPNWIAHWLLAPEKLRPQATMPRMLTRFPQEEVERVAADLAAFLAELSPEPGGDSPADLPPLEPAAAEARRERGWVLFEDRGCIACHRTTPPAEEDEYERLSLHYLGEKFPPAALVSFLQAPHAHFPTSRMPLFQLSREEAEALAAFLLARGTGKLEPKVTAGSAPRGREHFQSLGCVQCHETGESLRLLPGDSFSPLFSQQPRDRGCLAESPPRGVPHFPLRAEQRQALRNYLASDGTEALGRAVAVEYAERQFRQLNCRACHPRDGDFGNLPYVIQEEGEQGLPADSLPSLTWVGHKLQTEWTQRLLAGELPYRVRPHFRARMPAFPRQAERLARGLTHEAGLLNGEEPPPRFDPELARVGKEIAAMETGLSCARCHAVGSQPALAPNEALAPNFVLAAPRLRREYYDRWMLNPLRVEPETKMIQFAADGRRTTLTRFYEGESDRQFNALWHYLLELAEREPLPAARPDRGGEKLE